MKSLTQTQPAVTEIDANKLLDLLVREHEAVLDLESIGKLLSVLPDDILDDVFNRLHHEDTGELLSLHCCTGCVCSMVKRLIALGIEIGRRTAGQQKVQ
jgi:hypothetical protein